MISVNLKLSNLFLSHFLSAKVSPEWRINNVGYSEKVFLLLKNTDYVNIFLGPNFVSPGWRCPMNRRIPKEGFHCTLLATSESETANNCRKHNSVLTILLTAFLLTYIQLFQEGLSEKMCTRQSRKVIWDMINTLFLTL